MSKIFNWEYFSFVTFDDAVAYKVGSFIVKVIPQLSTILSAGSVSGARPDIRPLGGLDAAGEGTGGGGDQEGSN